jgi:hypothetical protein
MGHHERRHGHRKDMLQCLLEEKVRFLLVGAYAVAVHGYPRATKDMDVFVRAAPENASNLMRALRRFGARALPAESSSHPCHHNQRQPSQKAGKHRGKQLPGALGRRAELSPDEDAPERGHHGGALAETV